MICDQWINESTVSFSFNAEYSETIVRRLIEKITIYDEKITVEFKSGLEIDVEA